MNKIFLSKPPAAVESWSKACTWVKRSGSPAWTKAYVDGMLSQSSIPDIIHAVDVKIGKAVTQIEQRAFQYVTTLSSVYIPDSVSAIGGWAFFKNTALADAYIPDSVSAIGACAYSGCTALTSLRLSESLSSIENFSIENCCSLSSINIPDSVTSIGGGAFMGSSNIKVFDFGNTRTTIPLLADTNAFDNLSEDYKIVVPDALYENWSLSSANWKNDSIRPHIAKWSDCSQSI